MAFSTTWDVEKYKSEYESEEHWKLRKRFMETHKEKFAEDKLVCLARAFFNVEFLGCRYPEKTMQLVAELSKGVADEFREKQKGKLKRTFVQASDAAESKVKRLSTPLEPLSKKVKTVQDEGGSASLYSCFVHEELVKKTEPEGLFPGFIIYEHCMPKGVIETCPINIITHSVQKNKDWNTLKFDFPIDKSSDSPENKCCVITINNKVLSSGYGTTVKEAKLNAAKGGLSTLRKTCFTIQAKRTFFSDNPAVGKDGSATADTDKPLPQTNIGSKMMQKMGWTGSGLGKLQQGIQTPIQASSQIVQRSGFGRIDERDFQKKFRQIFKDYIASNSDNDLIFTPDFSSEERKVLHRIAQSMQLKTRSYGKDEDRRLVVFKVMPLPVTLNILLSSGGENEKYLLIHPKGESGPKETNL